MQIVPGDFSDPRVVALLRRHLEGMQAHSPPEACHVLDLSGLQAPDIRFWTAWDGEALMGCGALKALDALGGEVKSMRTDDTHLRKGVGAAILDHILAEARARGYQRISLETGSGPDFEAALSLYRRYGFTLGEAFGGYQPTPFTQFFHLDLWKDAVNGLHILPFTPERAQQFHDINVEWIAEMFRVEATDREVLENPVARIMAPGGDILFVAAQGLGIIGAGALQKTGDGQFELTKMGVLKSARGRNAGAFLLDALIRRAEELGTARLYLLTNTICATAIHLYEQAGFEHDEGIMRAFGARYERCNVAMLYRGR